MLRLSCKEITSGDCEFVAVGRKSRHIRDRIIDHLRLAHPDMVVGVGYEHLMELEERIRLSAHSEPSA